jgi:hypothetical protein
MPFKIAQPLEVTGAGSFTGNVSVPAGTTNLHAVNKLQLDTAINDLRNKDDSKPSVRATVELHDGEASAGTYTTYTGVALVVGDRVLAKFSPTFNGPYIVSVGAWVRADDGAITNQTNWRVEEGSDAGRSYVVTTAGTIIPGTTPFTIVQIAAAASLVGDSLGSTEIVSNQIRVKLDTGNANLPDNAIIRLTSIGTGLYVNHDDVAAYATSFTNYLTAVATTNITVATPPSTIDGVTLVDTAADPNTGSIPVHAQKFLLVGQLSNPGLYVLVNGVLQQIFTQGVYMVQDGTDNKGETWLVYRTNIRPKRLLALTYTQTILAGAAATHSITHNKRTTRPQVKLFDVVTNSELFAQPSNITLNSFDLVLSALANDVQVVVNITPDA